MSKRSLAPAPAESKSPEIPPALLVVARGGDEGEHTVLGDGHLWSPVV